MAALLICMPVAAQQPAVRLSLADSPYVRIGTIDGPPETTFAGIVAALHLPSGEIVVADGGNQVVRWFDGSGRHLRSVGREGEGPGEFRGIHWLGACPGGELLVIDPFLGRGTFLSAANGEVLRTSALPPSLRFNQPLACEAGGRLLVLMDRPVESGERGRVSRFAAPLVRFDLETGAADTLHTLPGTDFYFAARVPGFSYLPLGGQAYAAASGGRVYAGQNDAGVVHVVDTSTGTWNRFEHQLPRPRVTRDAWERAVRETIARFPLERTRQLVAEVLNEAPRHDRQPAYLGLIADAAGRVWLRLPSTAPSATWRIHDGAGSLIAEVELPANLHPLEIGPAHLVALGEGALDVQEIRLYRLPADLQRSH